MSVSFEETSPTLAANLKLSILFWTSEQLRPSQFYNWLAFNQTQWTRGRARSVTFHWNMFKPVVKSSSTQLSIYLAMACDLVWMWLLYYEIFNFMTLLSQFPKSCRILGMGWCPRTLTKNKKITTISGWFMCPDFMEKQESLRWGFFSVLVVFH